jgi:type I restriction enzyme, S subunit
MKTKWSRIQISELCQLIVDCVNKTAPCAEFDTAYKMIRTTNIKNGRINIEGCRSVEKETFEKWTRRAKVLKGDILLTREAPMGEVGLVNFHNTVFLGQRVMQYRVNPEKMDSNYLLYSFLSPDLQYQFRRHNASGSTVSHIRVPDCLKFEISLPPLTEQKKIAAVLSALDAKIECNNRINAELEAMAMTLYDYWFVQFEFPDRNGKPYKSSGGKMDYNPTLKRKIPEEWECKSLSHHLNCNKYKLGKNHTLSVIRYLDTANLTKNIIDLIQPFKIGTDNIPSRANMIVKNNDILYSTVRPNQCHYGLIKQPVDNMIASTGFALLSHKHNESLNDIFYLFLTSERSLQRLTKISESSKSSYPSISPDDILKLDIALPNSSQLLEKACCIINPIFEKFAVVQKENHHLTQLRDWLLPMLMNGQVTVA